jgi:hypothetical protein
LSDEEAVRRIEAYEAALPRSNFVQFGQLQQIIRLMKDAKNRGQLDVVAQLDAYQGQRDEVENRLWSDARTISRIFMAVSVARFEEEHPDDWVWHLTTTAYKADQDPKAVQRNVAKTLMSVWYLVPFRKYPGASGADDIFKGWQRSRGVDPDKPPSSAPLYGKGTPFATASDAANDALRTFINQPDKQVIKHYQDYRRMVDAWTADGARVEEAHSLALELLADQVDPKTLKTYNRAFTYLSDNDVPAVKVTP